MKTASLLFATAAILALPACATMGTGQGASANTTLLGADGTSHGVAKVTQTTSGLKVTVAATGLTPGVHAVHVHTTGTCTAPAFTSAGGHWNPMGKQHGMENPMGSHMGDMPNMTVNADGRGTLEYTIAGGALSDGTTPLFDADGAAVVVHALPDDNKSDPAGKAGDRLACGVLTLG
ncbi:superoxide dismutase family protein [soil metagenome]|jgi:Cu-Zn family superoxide dismutase|uniref:superoxide dismutase family protein n=1 Tax=unclassified Sphingobium TaxID=2611147 RepID=UPI001E3591AD|nr:MULTISPECIES: superoxide dismutase family protein [unclassified Sphingobium]GLI96464.1 superoxide dismutase [Sphingobium sp. BS19]CAH0353402.1 Superoxide dismutase-like protein YojM [Sphingobium sp. CECT 9361]